MTPQLCMRESTSLTASGFNTMSPVRGQTPPLAKVAAITDKLLQSVSSEEHCNTEDTGHAVLSSFTILLQLTSKLLPLTNKCYVDNLVEGFSVSEEVPKTYATVNCPKCWYSIKSKSYLWKVFGVMDQNINYDSNRVRNLDDFVLYFVKNYPTPIVLFIKKFLY